MTVSDRTDSIPSTVEAIGRTQRRRYGLHVHGQAQQHFVRKKHKRRPGAQQLLASQNLKTRATTRSTCAQIPGGSTTTTTITTRSTQNLH